jgi:Leucine-rich repeat (LRR) protein
VFSSLGSLQSLWLYHNQLMSLPENIFASLCSLKKLYLHNNHLASLPKNVFASLGSLEELWLYNNQLASLPENVFESLSSLRSLNLSNNHFAFRPLNVPSNVKLSFYPQIIPKVFVRENSTIPSSLSSTCLISHDEINVGNEYRMCKNPYVPHVYFTRCGSRGRKHRKVIGVRCAKTLTYRM